MIDRMMLAVGWGGKVGDLRNVTVVLALANRKSLNGTGSCYRGTWLAGVALFDQ